MGAAHDDSFRECALILLDGQQAGEMRDFDVQVMAGLVRSPVTHTMVLAQRADPGLDTHSYARELITIFDFATRASTS